MRPEPPSHKEAIQEILRVGGLSDCPMCMKNKERLWLSHEDFDETEVLRLICGNCHYIVTFDMSEIYRAIHKRRAGG